ncbi:hypothetical protein LSUE1_G010162, partial [Lachnellula suecica]
MRITTSLYPTIQEISPHLHLYVSQGQESLKVMSTQLAPISYASSVVGFVSFSLTVLIWLHAFWDGFLTLLSAPHEIPDAFSTLRQGLYEEREYLKRIRRRREGPTHTPSHKSLYYEGGPTKVMSNALKDLIGDFKQYEAPFLVTPHNGREKELEWSFDATQQAYRCDLFHRVRWLRSKGGVQSIAEKLQRMQTRRIAVEVTEARWMIG